MRAELTSVGGKFEQPVTAHCLSRMSVLHVPREDRLHAALMRSHELPCVRALAAWHTSMCCLAHIHLFFSHEGMLMCIKWPGPDRAMRGARTDAACCMSTSSMLRVRCIAVGHFLHGGRLDAQEVACLSTRTGLNIKKYFFSHSKIPKYFFS